MSQRNSLLTTEEPSPELDAKAHSRIPGNQYDAHHRHFISNIAQDDIILSSHFSSKLFDNDYEMSPPPVTKTSIHYHHHIHAHSKTQWRTMVTILIPSNIPFKHTDNFKFMYNLVFRNARFFIWNSKFSRKTLNVGRYFQKKKTFNDFRENLLFQMKKRAFFYLKASFDVSNVFKSIVADLISFSEMVL